MKILFSFLLASIFCFQYGNAQQLTKKHHVKKGETVYQISRIYNVSPQDIIKLNPNSAKVIYVDDVLIIPSNNNTNTSSNSSSVTNSTQSISHHVLRGETKYGLSKKYGLTIAELEQQNPHIKKGLQAGHYLSISSSKIQTPITERNQKITYKSHYVQKGETLYGLSKKYQVTIQEIKSANPQLGILKYNTTIAIPSTEVVVDNNEKTEESEKSLVEETSEIIAKKESQKVEVPVDDEAESTPSKVVVYENYTIKPKETLYSLSKQANMSKEEFVVLNPQLEKSVLAGTVIKMPASTEKALEIPVENMVSQSTSKVGYVNLLETIDKTVRKEIVFVMPFTENEFNSNNFENTNAEFKRNLDFYKGAKIAMDSIRKMGITLDSKIIEVDIETSVTPSNVRSKNSSLKGSHAVIAPSYSDNIDWLISLANDNNTPIVTAYNSSNNNNFTNIIEAYPSINYQRQKVLEYLKNQQGNIIVISDYNRETSRNTINTSVPKAQIIETRKNGNYSSRDLVNLLDKTKTNFVIIDSDRTGVFLNSTNTLLRELSQYRIHLVVLEKQLIPNKDEISERRFSILKMLYPEINNNDDSGYSKQFSEKYKIAFETELSNAVLEGFDITYDTLLRLCQPDGFNYNLGKNKTTYQFLEFKYNIDQNGRNVNDIVVVKEFENTDSNN